MINNLNSKIPGLRNSVVAILGLTQVSPPTTPTSGKPTLTSYNVQWGSGFYFVS